MVLSSIVVGCLFVLRKGGVVDLFATDSYARRKKVKDETGERLPCRWLEESNEAREVSKA